MKPETLEKWEAAACELWRETPELRRQYNEDQGAYLRWVRIRLEATQEWNNNPQIQKEFANDINLFLAYRKAESRGLITIIGRS